MTDTDNAGSTNNTPAQTPANNTETNNTPQEQQISTTQAPKASDEVSLLDEVKIEYDKAFVDDKGNLKTDELYKSWQQEKSRADGLRKKLSRGLELPPETENDYKVEIKEELKNYIPDNDPVVATLKKVGIAHDLNNSQINGIINDVASALLQQKMLVENNPQKSAEEQQKAIEEYKQAELKKLGDDPLKVISTIKNTLSGLKNTGYINDEEYIAAISMGIDAASVRVLEKLCAKAGEAPIPASPTGNVTGLTREQVLARYAEKDEKGNLKINDKDFLAQTRKLMEELEKNGGLKR